MHKKLKKLEVAIIEIFVILQDFISYQIPT